MAYNFEITDFVYKTPEQKLYIFKRRNLWHFYKNSGPIHNYLWIFKCVDEKTSHDTIPDSSLLASLYKNGSFWFKTGDVHK